MTVAGVLLRYLQRAPEPRRLRVAAHMPLERLPLVAIDCETTGLDPRRDRIVSFAAISIASGLHVIDRPLIDTLVAPGIPIPPRAAAVHGIDDVAVARAPAFAAVLDDITAIMHGSVIVGHHVGFDLAILAREAARARRAWREPPSLDTARLLSASGQPLEGLDLAGILARLGIEPRGRRHSAAGDARMSADLFVALAHRLIGQGHGTFGGAAACQRAPC